MARMMYCVKCRTKRAGKNHQGVTMKNGKKAVKATCEVCGTGMFLIGADVSEF
jgi:RNase P subunit RPR2